MAEKAKAIGYARRGGRYELSRLSSRSTQHRERMGDWLIDYGRRPSPKQQPVDGPWLVNTHARSWRFRYHPVVPESDLWGTSLTAERRAESWRRMLFRDRQERQQWRFPRHWEDLYGRRTYPRPAILTTRGRMRLWARAVGPWLEAERVALADASSKETA